MKIVASWKSAPVSSIIIFSCFIVVYSFCLSDVFKTKDLPSQSNEPRGGEILVLPQKAYAAIASLRNHHATCFSLSDNILKNDLLKQRIIEGAWPIIYDATCKTRVMLSDN